MHNIMLDENIDQSAEEIAEEAALQRELDGEEPLDDKPAGGDKEENLDFDKDIDDRLTPDDNPDDENIDDKDNLNKGGDNPDDNHSNDNDNKENSFKELSVTIDGVDITVNSEAELRTLTERLSEDASRTPINNEKRMLEQSKLTSDDIALMVAMKSGDKAAINKLLKDGNISLDDLDDAKDEAYKQDFKYEDITETEQLAEQIMSNKAFAEEYQGEVQKLPKDFAAEIHGDAKAMKHFMKHVESGLTKELIPAARKASVMEKIPFMEAYARIGREMAGKDKPDAPKSEKRKVDEESRSRRGKRSANRSDTPKEHTPHEIATMSEADFVKYYGD